MRFTAAMTAREFAAFLVKHTTDPTEGMIVDALRQAGSDDEEVQDALEWVQQELSTDTDIDIPDDIDLALEEEEAQADKIEEEIDESTGPLDAMPVDVPGDLAESYEPEGEFDEEDPSFAEDPMGFDPSEETPEGGDSVAMQPDELFQTMNQFMEENPDASEEDLTRYLHNLGMPGDKINNFLGNGLDMLRASHQITNFIFTSASADISWMAAAKIVKENNPNITTDQLRQALEEAGASRIEVEEVMRQLPPDQPEMPEQPVPDQMAGSMDPNGQGMQPAPPMPPNRAQAKTEIRSNTGERTSPYLKETYMDDNFEPQIQDRVQTPKGSARIAGVLPSFSGDIYEVVLNDGSVEHFGINALSAYQEEKTASTGIFQRVASHVEEEWYTDSAVLPRSHKAGYEKRLEATEALLKDVKGSLKTAAADEQTELMRIDIALTHEARYLRDKIATAFTADDAEYLGSQPKFRVSASRAASEMGQRTAALDLAFAAASEEASSVDWKHEVTAGAELFVEEISPVLIGSSGDVRRMAARHIEAKTAALEENDARNIRNAFIDNAEKARRRVVKELRQATPKQASTDLPDGASDEGVFF